MTLTKRPGGKEFPWVQSFKTYFSIPLSLTMNKASTVSFSCLFLSLLAPTKTSLSLREKGVASHFTSQSLKKFGESLNRDVEEV